MKILDIDSNKPLQNICLYLTDAEAGEMKIYLEKLIKGEIEHHVHFNDRTYEKEITIAIYSEDNLEHFDERSKKLIKEGV